MREERGEGRKMEHLLNCKQVERETPVSVERWGLAGFRFTGGIEH
jgi:hypothetical protein